MILGIFAKIFPGSEPLGVLQAARAAGYRSVQYNLACSGLGSLPLTITAETAGRIRAASEETGVAIAAISATYNMVHPDQGVRACGRQSFAAIAEAAKAIGGNLLTVCTGSRDPVDQWRHHPENQGAQAWQECCQEMQSLVEVAERRDVQIGVEPELANVVNTPRRALELIEALGSDRIRIVLDPANLFETADAVTRRRTIEEAIDLVGDRLALAHAKDRQGDGTFATVGRGSIDFAHFLGRLDLAGFEGCVVTHGLAAHEAKGVSTFLSDLLRPWEDKP